MPSNFMGIAVCQVPDIFIAVLDFTFAWMCKGAIQDMTQLSYGTLHYMSNFIKVISGIPKRLIWAYS